MTTMLGVVVLAREVAGVLVRGERVVWRHSIVATGSATWEVLLDELLADTPRQFLDRLRVRVALGPSFGLFRELHGVPQELTSKELTHAVRLAPERFFAMLGPLEVTDACSVGGKWWAGCLRVDTLSAATSILRARKLGISAITLLTACVAVSASSGYREIADGDDTIGVARDGGSGEVFLRRMRRVETEALGTGLDLLAESETLARLRAVPAFPILGEVPWRQFLGHPADFALNGLILFGFLVALILPPWLTSRAGTLLQEAVARERVQWDSRRALAVSPIAIDVAKWASARFMVSNYLAELSDALPMGSAILTFHQDSLGLSVVALTSDAAALFRSVEGLPGVGRATAIGPMTRERIGSRELSRVALHANFEARSTP